MLIKALDQQDTSKAINSLTDTLFQKQVRQVKSFLLREGKINDIRANNDFKIKRGDLHSIISELRKKGIEIHHETTVYCSSDISVYKICEFDMEKYNGNSEKF